MLVTYEYYTSTFYGLPLAETDFPQYEAWAERVISAVTRNRVTAETFSTYSSVIQTAYKDAICAQISYFTQVGIEVAMTGIMQTGFTVGKVSVSQDSRVPAGRTSIVCPAAIAFLEQTGLMYNGVATPFRGWA